MNTKLTFLLPNVLLLFSLSLCASATPPDLAEEGKQRIGQFAKELQSTLKQAITEGGLPSGIEVCKQKAPAIANKYSDANWTLSRTSLQTRNPDNAPDTWERSVLQQFEQQNQQGKPTDQMLATTWQEENGEQVFRMMKAIPAQGLCLACHGKNLDASVQQTLQQLYPKDQATGYEAGDIRGAFTLTYKP